MSVDFGIPIFLIISVALLSCHKESLVDAELQPYLNLFKEEAALRNITVDYDKKVVEARIELHDADSRLGWCDFDFSNHHTVIINALFWEVMDEFRREKLVFHELGHCVLSRSHDDTKRADGKCKSIMHSGQACSDDYNESTRSQYLDELFLRR